MKKIKIISFLFTFFLLTAPFISFAKTSSHFTYNQATLIIENDEKNVDADHLWESILGQIFYEKETQIKKISIPSIFDLICRKNDLDVLCQINIYLSKSSLINPNEKFVLLAITLPSLATEVAKLFKCSKKVSPEICGIFTSTNKKLIIDSLQENDLSSLAFIISYEE